MTAQGKGHGPRGPGQEVGLATWAGEVGSGSSPDSVTTHGNREPPAPLSPAFSSVMSGNNSDGDDDDILLSG